MQEVITLSTSKMQDSDLAAIAEYLKSLPAQAEAHPKPPPRDQMARGQAVFVSHCSVCHLSTESAHGSREFPLLDGDTLIQARNPTTVLHVLLEGSQSPKTDNAPTGLFHAVICRAQRRGHCRCRDLYPQRMGQSRRRG